jgi:flagellar biosynthesis protein FlhF
MKVKRYIVDDLPEAVQLIRSELGSDAVILNTKEIRVGGFLGMFSKKRVEVIAAIDEATKKPPARATPIIRPAPSKPQIPQTEEPQTLSPMLPSNAIRDKYSQAPFADSVRKTAAPPKGVQRDAGQSVALASSFQATFEQAQEQQSVASSSTNSDTQAATLAAAVKTLEARESKQAAEETSALLQELRSMKEMMTKLTKQQTNDSMPKSIVRLSKRLAEQGVEPQYIEQFAEAVFASVGYDSEAVIASAYSAAREILFTWLSDVQGAGMEPTTRIVHFVGPTGVGKTTTIAKLAAEQSFTHRRSVGFITADTYRIAAVDQLRTYADILNVPLEVVFSPSELNRAYKKLSDRDLLFMDTAGRNYRNELFVSEVNSLLAPGEQTETILVLSMTHKYNDMKLVASQFVKYGVNQLLLTKFDETDSFGSVINLAKEFDFRISYITCGQAVPDDIRPFDPEDLVRRLLGDPSDE